MKTIKLYLATLNLVFIAIVLLTYFKILPSLIEAFSEIFPTQAKIIKDRISFITIGGLIFIFLVDFYFFKMENSLEKIEKEAQTILKINPQDLSAKSKLEEIERKRKNLHTSTEIILRLFIGFIIGLIAVSIISPLYRLIGAF